jgi:hypothetical protein
LTVVEVTETTDMLAFIEVVCCDFCTTHDGHAGEHREKRGLRDGGFGREEGGV